MNRPARGRPRGPKLARLSVAVEASLVDSLDRRIEGYRALIGPGFALNKADMVEMALRAFLKTAPE